MVVFTHFYSTILTNSFDSPLRTKQQQHVYFWILVAFAPCVFPFTTCFLIWNENIFHLKLKKWHMLPPLFTMTLVRVPPCATHRYAYIVYIFFLAQRSSCGSRMMVHEVKPHSPAFAGIQYGNICAAGAIYIKELFVLVFVHCLQLEFSLHIGTLYSTKQ